MRSLVWLLLFMTTWAYWVTEYNEERCTHNGCRAYQLADANTCQKLDICVASSILVKIDNFHDDQYELNVYENNDCTGDVAGSISNLNGCMNLFSHDSNRVGRSVKLTPKSASTEPERQRGSASENFEAGRLFNAPFLADKSLLVVPVERGAFQFNRRSDRCDDGTYCSNAIEIFRTGPLGELLAQEEADKLAALESEKWHEKLLNQGGFYFKQAYAAVADWGERLLRAD
ncbi:hypothetical protein PHISP_05476 [Aspergillus sp. HF37]|nr:hypothetical protein PHISP_05476 [Aspergillus sp. HF37]